MSEKTSPVFLIATANDVSALPPEMLRKGRFDEIFYTDLPTPEEREAILRIHMRKRNVDPDGFSADEWKQLIDVTGRTVGSELEQMVCDARFASFASMASPTEKFFTSAPI
jgi:SpoVK/Ycf46/Vps4 family AAA+-type ATPase